MIANPARRVDGFNPPIPAPHGCPPPLGAVGCPTAMRKERAPVGSGGPLRVIADVGREVFQAPRGPIPSTLIERGQVRCLLYIGR